MLQGREIFAAHGAATLDIARKDRTHFLLSDLKWQNTNVKYLKKCLQMALGQHFAPLSVAPDEELEVFHLQDYVFASDF